MKKIGFVYIFLILISVISLTSAEVLISQPKALYNFGDELNLEIKLTESKPGYLDVNLVCPNSELNLYHNVPESQTISLKRKLLPIYIAGSMGDCYLSSLYGEEVGRSQNFKISQKIEISLDLTQVNYNIGETFKIKGKAYKENGGLVGQFFEGFVELRLNDNTSSTNVVKDSQFNAEFSFPSITHAGTYSLPIKVYEKSGGDIINIGETFLEVIVIQRLAKLQIELSNQSITPGEELEIIPSLYDFAGDLMEGQVLMKIEDSQASALQEGFVNANQNFVLQTETKTSPGYAKILIQKENLTSEKSFEILKLEKINAKIENQTLIINNIGNVPYSGIIEIQIGSEKVLKEVELGLGEEKEFFLSAPDGDYDILIKDETPILAMIGVPITGQVISVSEINDKINSLVYKYPFVWIFIILIFAFFAYSWLRKLQKTRRIGMLKSEPKKEVNKKGGVEIVNHEEIMDKITLGEIRKAEQVITLHGQKNNVSVIAIKIKNELAGISRTSLTKSLEYAYKAKAVSFISGNNVLLIFSPLITRSLNNEERAVRCAMNIERALREHNKRFKDKIIFGIGVHIGELLNKVEDNILKFATLGKTITIARRIAEVSSEEVLLSKEIHNKTMNNIKAEKNSARGLEGLETFKIKRIVNTEASKKFIDEFLRRN